MRRAIDRARASRFAVVLAISLTLGCSVVLDYPEPAPERGLACANGTDDDLDGLTDDADPDCASPFARACSADAECHPLACGALTTGERVCSPACTPSADTCPAGWSCEPTSSTCTCTPCVERCNLVDDDCDGRVDETTCAIGEVCQEGTCTCDGGRTYALANDELDLLLVVDDSNSMIEEQTSVLTALPAAITALTSGDIEADGIRDFAPVGSLHLGVVTTDMGSGTVDLASCSVGLGDDGILRASEDGCSGPAGVSIFEFSALTGDPEEFTRDASCVVAAGTRGCGFEFQLDAPLKALSPATATDWVRGGYVPPVFYEDTRGHGDGANAGFVRPGSVLAIVLVTDEEDCSTANRDLFSRTDPRFSDVDLNLRCFMYPDEIYPVQRYVDGFLQLRTDPGNLLFAAIVGVPVEAADLSLAATLEHPRMRESVDPTPGPARLTPSCIGPGGMASPPRRIVQVARGLECAGAQASVHSICETDLSPAFVRILEAFGRSEDRRVCVREDDDP